MEEDMKVIYALNNELRFEILKLLLLQNYYACEIPLIVKRNQPTVSHQLSKLLNLGVIGVKKIGNKRLYYLLNEKIKTIMKIFENDTSKYK